MDLFKEILAHAIAGKETHIVFLNLASSAAELVEMESYKALQKIKAILEDDSLDDFMSIEEIVCVLEGVGSNGGSRHDFG